METETSAGGAVKMKVEELRVTKSGMGWGGARVWVGGDVRINVKRVPNMNARAHYAYVTGKILCCCGSGWW